GGGLKDLELWASCSEYSENNRKPKKCKIARVETAPDIRQIV
ncbi:hypothetical protein AC249_AIPGENE16265, partial [Exaiptasia diaphana]